MTDKLQNDTVPVEERVERSDLLIEMLRLMENIEIHHGYRAARWLTKREMWDLLMQAYRIISVELSRGDS